MKGEAGKGVEGVWKLGKGWGTSGGQAAAKEGGPVGSWWVEESEEPVEGSGPKGSGDPSWCG